MTFPQKMFNNLQEFLNSLSDISVKQIRYELTPSCIIIFLNENNKINKTLKEEQIKNFMFTFNNILNSEEVYFDASCLTDKQFYNNIFVVSLNELIKYCPAIDKIKVSEMVQDNTKKNKTFKSNKSDIIEEGIGDWWQKVKDNKKTADIDADYEKVINARRKESAKIKNDAVNQVIQNIQDHLDDNGSSWANLYKSLKKMGIKNDSILKSFIKLFDDNGKAPGYKVISQLANIVADKANLDSENDMVKTYDENYFQERIKDFADEIQKRYDFDDKIYFYLARQLRQSEVNNKKIPVEKLLDIAIERAKISPEVLKKHTKEQVDINDELSKTKEPKKEPINAKEKESNAIQQKQKDLLGALRQNGYNKETAMALMKTIPEKEFKDKSVEDLYLLALKAQAQNIFKNSKTE